MTDDFSQVALWGAVAQWLERGLTIEWSLVRILLRPFGNFGNFLYPTLPVSFGRDTKSRWSLLSGVYARGSKRSHQSALEMCTVVDSTTHSNPPPPTCNKPYTLRDAVTGRNRNPLVVLPRRYVTKKKRYVPTLYGRFVTILFSTWTICHKIILGHIVHWLWHKWLVT